MDLLNTKVIFLSKDMVTVVDAQDYEWLSQWKWHYVSKNSGAGRVDKNKKRVLMHRVILNKYSLLDINLEVDHINRNPLDNRKSNLRMVTRRQNALNRGLPKNNKSGYKGVFFDKSTTNKFKKWQARIHVYNKFINLGRFLTKEEAAFAYNKAAIKYHGKYAYINQIGGNFGLI